MAKAKKEATASAAEGTFTYGEKNYKVVIHAVIIPGLGRRTAEEILVDEEAQKYLVEEKSAAVEEVA